MAPGPYSSTSQANLPPTQATGHPGSAGFSPACSFGRGAVARLNIRHPASSSWCGLAFLVRPVPQAASQWSAQGCGHPLHPRVRLMVLTRWRGCGTAGLACVCSPSAAVGSGVAHFQTARPVVASCFVGSRRCGMINERTVRRASSPPGERSTFRIRQPCHPMLGTRIYGRV